MKTLAILSLVLWSGVALAAPAKPAGAVAAKPAPAKQTGSVAARAKAAPAPVVDPLSLTTEAPVTRGALLAMAPTATTTNPAAKAARPAKPGRPQARPAARPATPSANALPSGSAPSVPPVPTKAASALPATARRPAPEAKRDFTALVSLGLDLRGERDQQQSTIPRSWPTLTLGLGLKPWLALLEYASFSENSGNNALNVQRKVETLMLWGQWAPDEEDWIVQPYMGVGFGGYRTSADMTLYSERASAQGKWIENGAAALGLRLAKLSPFLLAVEGRVHMNRELDPSPTLSGMIKLGFILE